MSGTASPQRAARRRARWAAIAAALFLSAGCATLTLRGSFERLDLAWQDFALHLRHDAGLDPVQGPLAIVAYDDASAARYTLDRLTTARLVDRLHAAGTRLILLDRLYEDSRPATASLATALRRAGSVVLAQEVTVSSSAYSQAFSLVGLEPTIARAARAVGIVNVPPPPPGGDGRYRTYNADVLLDSQGHSLPSFALAAARAAGVQPHVPGPTFLINFAGPAGKTFPHYSLAGILDGRQDLSSLTGKIVLVGDEVAADKDIFPTPADGQNAMYGVELHAHALNTLLAAAELTRASPAVQVLLTFPAALLAAAWALRRWLLSSLALSLGLMAAYLGAALIAFVAGRLWLDVTGPLLATLLAPLAVLGVRLGTEQRANRELRSLFSRYVAPGVVARIVDDPDAFGLEGELREITVLFADIRNFTTLSEPLPPQRIVRLLSRYFTAMVEEIQAHGGTVDKYVGDAIMALFGAPDAMPDAPLRAVRAALAMQERLVALNADLSAAGEPLIATGIGLHHGPAAVGVIGAPAKREYSAIGDTVNTASRLEGLTKEAGYAIVLSSAVVSALPADFQDAVAPHDLGELALKGRAERVHVFGLAPIHRSPAHLGEGPQAAEGPDVSPHLQT